MHAIAYFSATVTTYGRTAVKNKKLTLELEAIIQEAGVSNGCPKQQGTLLYDCASKVGSEVASSKNQLLPKLISAQSAWLASTSHTFGKLDCCVQYPDNAKENRKQFMLDFIMTGKIQVSQHLCLCKAQLVIVLPFLCLPTAA